MTRMEQMLNWLERHRDRDVIKIITGVRGCGKSTLLGEFAKRLQTTGVAEDHIIRIDFEHSDNRHLHTPEDLLAYIKGQTPASGKVYLLLDEICELQEFDVALERLFALKHYDIVAVSSNRHPISNPCGKHLTGHFIHAEMLTPSFRERPDGENIPFEQRLDDCLRLGDLPYTFPLRDAPQRADIYLSGLWNTILVKDIFTRNRMVDPRFAERLLEHIYDHLGETESLRKISADATIEGHEPAPNTVLSYIEALDESMLVHRVPRYDVFLGETTKGGYRFYLADLALGRARYGNLPRDPANAVRNLIYLELLGRGGTVYCGRYDKDDFDFVIIRDGHVHCWQFAPETTNGRIPAAVLRPFKHMPRDIQKTVITRGEIPQKPLNGISFITLEQFLTGESHAPWRHESVPAA